MNPGAGVTALAPVAADCPQAWMGQLKVPIAQTSKPKLNLVLILIFSLPLQGFTY